MDWPHELDAHEPVGDPVCWLPQVCEECGRIHDERSSGPLHPGAVQDPHAAGAG